MAGERKLTVVLAGDSRGLDRALGKAKSSVGGFGSKLGSLTKTAGVAFAGLGAGAVVLGKGFVDAAVESEKVAKQTEAVLKSMGNQAGVTAEWVGTLSSALSRKAGVDDELIQSSANVLLTFGKIRNSGEGVNAVFDRATSLALDMSVALGTDMKSASIQVGKALNDPVKGITALGRAGVSFSEDQKKAIKQMVKTGDTLDAQKLILSELDKQFGGSAKAQATAGDRLKVVWGNLQEELGAKLLPVVEKVAAWLADKLPVAFAKGEEWFNRVAAVVRDNWPQIRVTAEQVMTRVRTVVEAVVGFVREHWPEIQRVITDVMRTISTVISGVVSVITTLWDNFGNNILSFVQRVWPNIQQTISGALEVIRGVIQTVTALIKGDWSGVWDGIKGIVRGAWEAIQGIVKGALEALRLVIGGALEVLGSVVKGAIDGVKATFGELATKASQIAGAVVGHFVGVVTWFRELPAKLGDAASRAWNALKRGLKAAIDWIIEQIDRALGPLDELLAGLARINLSPTGGVDWSSKLGLEGRRASGGPVSRGTWLVGEHGPELLTMGGNGFVTPNHMLGTVAAGPQITVDLRGSFIADGVQFDRIIRKAIQDTVSREGGIAGTNIIRQTSR